MALEDLSFGDSGPVRAGITSAEGLQAALRKADGMDPMTTSALISAGSNVLGKALSPGGAGPSRADATGYLTSDNSGFVVNTGSGSASASLSGLSPWLLALAALALVLWFKKK